MKSVLKREISKLREIINLDLEKHEIYEVFYQIGRVAILVELIKDQEYKTIFDNLLKTVDEKFETKKDGTVERR